MTQVRAMSPFLIPGNVTIRETQKVTTVQQRLLKRLLDDIRCKKTPERTSPTLKS